MLEGEKGLSKKILLVEDEVLIAMNESMLLEEHGYSVYIEHTGEDAVNRLKKESFDLILMDIDLGSGMDGTEAAKNILSFCEVPVVFLSSHTEPEIVEKTEGITSYGYIVKNSGSTVLLASIKMAFRLYDARKSQESSEKILIWERNRFKQYLNIAEVMLLLIGPEGNIKTINAKGCKILGYDEKDLVGLNWFDNFIPSDKKSELKNAFDKIVRDKVNFDEYYENWIKCKNNRHRLIAWHNSLLEDETGEVIGVFCSGEDITATKEHENALNTSRNDFYQLFYGLKDGAVIYRPTDDLENFIIEDMNDSGQKIAGICREDVIGKLILDVFPDSRNMGLFPILQEVAVTGETRILPFRNYKDDKLDDWLENYVFPLPSGLIVAIFSDQKTLIELRNNESKLRIINELSSDYSYCNALRSDGSLEPVWHIGSFDSITGYPPEELYEIGGWRSLIHPEDLEEAGEYIKKLLSGEKASFTARIITQSGDNRWIQDHGMPWYDEVTGKVIGTYGFARDITEKKAAQDELEKKELKYRMLYLNAPLPYQSLDNSGNLIDVNPAWLNTLGYKRSEVIGHNFTDFMHQDSKSHFIKYFPEYKANGNVNDVQYMIKHKDGSYREMSFEGCIGDNSEGTNIQTYCVFKDITEQKMAERENELLMRELNHRVKNNLLMVSSLIKLKNIELDGTADLSDLIGQIDAIALIHKYLEQNNNISQVNIKTYIEQLVESVFTAVKQFEIKTLVDIKNIEMNTRIAVILGIIINEIATNALKYGFKEGDESFFSIKQTREANKKHIVFSISNSGNEFPDDVEIENSKGLGLKLIRSLVTQLNGAVKLKKKPKTTFILKIPV